MSNLKPTFYLSVIVVVLIVLCAYCFSPESRPSKVDESPFPTPEEIDTFYYKRKGSFQKIPMSRYHEIYKLFSENDTIYGTPPAGDIVAYFEASSSGKIVSTVKLLLYEHPVTVKTSKGFALWFQVNNSPWIGVNNPIEIIDLLLDIDREAFPSLEFFRKYVNRLD